VKGRAEASSKVTREKTWHWFAVEKLKVIPYFSRDNIASTVLSVDKAGTAGGDGAFTAIVIMHKMKDGSYLIERVIRGHWAAPKLHAPVEKLLNASTDFTNVMGRRHPRHHGRAMPPQRRGRSPTKQACACFLGCASDRQSC
jgi:hypothetical protein